MERKITLEITDQQQIQEILAGLKGRQEETQKLMNENSDKWWINKGLDMQRRAQRKLIADIKKQLNPFNNQKK
jgi:hypothetical protein